MIVRLVDACGNSRYWDAPIKPDAQPPPFVNYIVAVRARGMAWAERRLRDQIFEAKDQIVTFYRYALDPENMIHVYAVLAWTRTPGEIRPVKTPELTTDDLIAARELRDFGWLASMPDEQIAREWHEDADPPQEPLL